MEINLKDDIFKTQCESLFGITPQLCCVSCGCIV